MSMENYNSDLIASVELFRRNIMRIQSQILQEGILEEGIVVSDISDLIGEIDAFILEYRKVAGQEPAVETPSDMASLCSELYNIAKSYSEDLRAISEELSKTSLGQEENLSPQDILHNVQALIDQNSTAQTSANESAAEIQTLRQQNERLHKNNQVFEKFVKTLASKLQVEAKPQFILQKIKLLEDEISKANQVLSGVSPPVSMESLYQFPRKLSGAFRPQDLELFYKSTSQTRVEIFLTKKIQGKMSRLALSFTREGKDKISNVTMNATQERR